MGEFFKGWRRKAGLVTLAMALVLMAGWLRSYVKIEAISFGTKGTTHLVESFNGQLRWSRGICPFWPAKEVKWMSVDMSRLKDRWCFWDISNVQWRWKWAGFNFGTGSYDIWERIDLWSVPYWSFVLPLTLLSAWLILAKPRKAKVATGSTP